MLDKFGMADARQAKTPAEAGPICIEETEILSTEDTKVSGLPRVLSFTLAGARGRASLTQ